MSLEIGTNAYISADEADTYLNGSLTADSWLTLDEEVKERAIISATRMLDRQRWMGEKTDPAQLLQFPRTGLTDSYGTAVASEVVPQAIKDATAELALSLALDPSVQDQAGTQKGIKRVKAGSAEVEFFFSSVNKRFSTVVSELVSAFLGTGYSRVGIGGFASGTDQCTGFTPGRYDRSESL